MSEITYPCGGGPELESYVSRLLDEAGVPNFIWAEPVLGIYGVGTIIFAAQALDEAKLPACTQGREECSVFWERRAHPYPDHHWHTDQFYPPRLFPPQGWPMTCGVFLYRKSRLFWTFLDPPIGRPAPDDPYYMLTSDPRIEKVHLMARGSQPETLYPVKMPITGRYMEAMFLLTLRDLEGSILLSHWEIEISYLTSWVLDAGVNLKLEDLSEPFREWARLLTDKAYARRQGDRFALKFQHKLYADMAADKQLPPIDDMRFDTYIPLEERMRKYDLPFDPAWLTPAELKNIWG